MRLQRCSEKIQRGCEPRIGLAFLAGLLMFVRQSQSAQDSSPPTVKKTLDPVVQQFMLKTCVKCHSGDEPAGDLHMNRLSADFSQTAARAQWADILNRVRSGAMPPESEPRPDPDALRQFTAWIGHRLIEAEATRRAAEGRTVLRRLNRIEYQNTLRDLLGIKIDLQQMLPPDSSADGFDNVGEALHVSSFLLERYLDAADAALNLAIANYPQPPLVQKRLSLRDERLVKTTTEKVFRPVDDTGLALFSSSAWNAITFGQFYPPDRGTYRFRIAARAIQSAGQSVSFRIEAGPMLMGSKNHLVGYFDAPPDETAIIEFTEHLEARNTIRLLPHGLATAHTVNPIGADKYQGPGLAIAWIEVEGPLHAAWPPASHRRIFGDLPQELLNPRDWRKRMEVTSRDATRDAERILNSFTRRAWRRSINSDDIAPLMALFHTKTAEGYSFEQSVRVALKAALVSPEFLFLREAPGRLDDFALASRLSYFLWSSMPDDELLELAAQSPEANSSKRLSDPVVLREQVERLLKDSRAKAFTVNFTGQWLNLRDIDFTEPDRRLYPEFDDLLKAAVVQEAHLFFDEVLTHDLSLTNFVASDFTMLNQRLAQHYGIPDVKGHAFRKVMLPPDSHRGGVMTMASVLKVTANGTSTSPVVRGAWVLDRLLGTPPSPPPSGVSAVEPDIRGAVTIREQLAKHRQIESCASCHTQIDPPGFALENFDVIGGWREYYRSIGRGQPVSIDGRRMPYSRGLPVEPADTLPDGRTFENIDGLKRLLLADPDQLARSLTVKLLTYATGQAPRDLDRDAVDRLVSQLRERNDGLRSLVHAIVQSDLFQQK